MKRYTKKTQVSIFIILGIILLFGFFLISGFVNSNKTEAAKFNSETTAEYASTDASITQYVQKCIMQTLEKGLVATNYPEQGFEVRYLEYYLDLNLHYCINNFEGYDASDIVEGQPKSTIILKNDNLSLIVKMNYPLEFTNEGKAVKTSFFQTEFNSVAEYPSNAISTVGTPSVIIGNNELNYDCNDYLFSNAWSKPNTTSADVVFTFDKKIFPRTLIVYGINPLFTKAEAWNDLTGSWETVWSGESINCITYMNFKEINYKINKIKITSPISLKTGIYTVKLVVQDELTNFPTCEEINGWICTGSKVCKTNVKNSADSDKCCEDECE